MCTRPDADQPEKRVLGGITPEGAIFTLMGFFAEQSASASTVYFYVGTEEVSVSAAGELVKAGTEGSSTEMRMQCAVSRDILPAGVTSAVYFVRKSSAEIGAGDVDQTMPDMVEFGTLTSDCLSNMSQVLRGYFSPFLDAPGDDAGVVRAQKGDNEVPEVVDSMRNEFRGNMLKFSSQVEHAIQQVKGDVHLHVPNIIIDDPEAVATADEYKVTSQLEAALAEWTQSVAQVVDQQSKKTAQGRGPLAEIEHWRQRNSVLSALHEQISMPNIQQMLECLRLLVQMKSVEENMFDQFNSNFLELTKLYVEAKDNVKFLTTLERHFKNISTGTFSVIVDTLPSMMNAIRMVWIISRHYNTDDRMVPLMERIGMEIAEKVAVEVDIRTILQSPPEIALQTTQEAKKVLQMWHKTYVDERFKIEDSGAEKRWEFDKRRLFEQTNYMAKICTDLSEVATVLEQFHKFLGPELKAVTGDSYGIDRVMRRVEGLVKPFDVPFNIFDRQYSASWDLVMAKFRESVEEIETMTHKFVNQSFKKLRDAEGAFDLLQNFKTMQSRESINKQMQGKYKDILVQYSKELDNQIEIFDNFKQHPPVYKNYPPVAGAISWARALYQRAKKPVLKFRTMPDLLKSEHGEAVKGKYLQFARGVDAYIKGKFNEWKEGAPDIATNNLKKAVLGPDMENGAIPAGPFFVNFSPDLKLLVQECKYLDRMGFIIPVAALNVTLQEKSYHDYEERISALLQRHSTVTMGLSAVETDLLKSQLAAVQEELAIGFKPLNWNSQRIESFIVSCSSKLDEFIGIVSQIQKSSSMIDDVIENIAQTRLVMESDFPPDVEPLDITDFYERVEQNRLSRLEGLARKYRGIFDFLLKVEEIIAGTASSKSKRLVMYYEFWERRIYNAITKMVVSSMATFQALMYGQLSSCMFSQDIVEFPQRSPLYKVKLILKGNNMALNPPIDDIKKYMVKSVKNITESSKQFLRWKRFTCIECDPIQIQDGEDEEPHVYHFYNDIENNPYVVEMHLALHNSLETVVHKLTAFKKSWEKYDKVEGLWNAKKRQALEKLKEKSAGKDAVFFDLHLGKYSSMSDELRSQATQQHIGFLMIDCSAAAETISQQALEWKNDYGRILHELAQTCLNVLNEKLDHLESDLATDPKDLDSLKFVLNSIASIQEMGMDMELQYSSMFEQYRTLGHYAISVPEAERKEAISMEERWCQLVRDSKTKDLRLIKVKEQFRDVTRQDAVDFGQACKDLKGRYMANGPGNADDLDDGVTLASDYEQELAQMRHRRHDLVNAEGLFNLPITAYPELNDVAEDLQKQQQIYQLYGAQKDFVSAMSSTLWSELDVSNLITGAETLEKKCRKLPKEIKELSTFVALEKLILGFKESIPLLASLKNDAMKPRHWETLMDLTGVKFDMNPKTFTLDSMFAMKLERFADDVNEVVQSSMGESKIENELRNVEDTWRANKFELGVYRKNGEIRGYVLRSAEQIKLELEDNMLNLQSMSASRFVGQCAEQVRDWEKKLNLVNECIDVWFVVQRKWMYLESIFVGAEDIRLQLPEEAKKFDAIDKTWKQIMIATNKNRNVIDACHADSRMELLAELSERLDKCQKSLSDYLDTKRNSFPRFFFISDDELLSVLGSSDPTSIQEHALKLFDNVKVFGFSKSAKQVLAMESSQTEAFDFRTPAVVEGAVEVWMYGVEEEMKASLQQITKEGVFHYAKKPRVAWLGDNLGMVVLAGTQIWWTWEVEDVFRRVSTGDKYAMKTLEVKLTKQLNDLVAAVREKLDKQTRVKVNTLLIIDVHARDIVDTFVRDSILNAKEFAWESQLRYYWDRDVDDIIIQQCTGTFRYGYEYMGLNGRLVITPLTDRCYMTITQALTFKLGCSPAGPAGTGKTETVKDLSKGLALPCFVINCGEGLDYKAMGSTFSGLVQVGGWGCFDEFNRINIEVLSVVSTQLKSIQNALEGNKATCDVGTGDIYIKRKAGFATCGFFITMNPGYAGRTELPDNLKALFRPVTMIVPDLQQICQIMLFSEGFEGAVVLAKKMTVLYSLSKGQLSKQYHYDFGLRALKSVLVLAGGLKREHADLTEDMVLMRALRDSNMPKFVFEDVPLFQGLIGDLFPGLDVPRVGNVVLKSAIEADLEHRGMHHADEPIFQEQVDKVLQMYETQLVRHTTMIVGPTGGGKTVVLETLRNASATALDIAVKMFHINPKAQSVNELYGVMDPQTRDWTDGVLSHIFRDLNQPLPAGKENEQRWIIFDGDVDAVWVENMNSVMDDNRLLTLPNGERIRLNAHCSMICETFDLQYASPATISRCGMVWVDPQNLGFKPYTDRWINERCADPTRSQEKDILIELFDMYVKKCIDFVHEGLVNGEITRKLAQVIPMAKMSLVKQLCSSLDAFLPGSSEAPEREVMEGMFLFSIVWSIGAALLGDDRVRFDEFLKSIAISTTPSASLYDSFYEPEMGWQVWADHIPEYVQPAPFEFQKVLVHTTDSVLYTYLLNMMLPGKKPVLFVGESGTAKTVTIQNYLSTLDDTAFSLLNVNFSSRTSSMDVQTNIEANVDKRAGRVYGPPSGKSLIVFIDDMNMPKVDAYGTQQPIALLHFLVGRQSMYNRGKDLDLRIFKDLMYINAMGPPGGGRNNTDPRYAALFNVYNLTPPTEGVLDSIYSSIITSYVRADNFSAPVADLASKLTAMMLSVFHFVSDNLPPTPSKFHYIFNLRDLSRVCEGVCLATSDMFSEPSSVLRLWVNEMKRIFCDRLTSVEDVKAVTESITGVVREHCSGMEDAAMAEPCLFGDFAHAVDRISEGAEDARLYQDLKDFGTIRTVFDGVLEAYNLDMRPMTLVLFEEALEHVTRIHRILRMPRGNALLIGVGGSGKQSLTKLATFTAGYTTFEISLVRGYGEAEFKEDLKELYKKLAVQPIVFLFTDAHVVEPGFLEFINNMLSTGMIPSLFEQDEKDGFISSVRGEVQAAGIVVTNANCWNYFVNKARNNLHVVLAMSPSGDTLRIRCRNFPGMVSSSVIDWFFSWPKDALSKVAHAFLEEETLLPKEYFEGIVDHCVHTHQGVEKFRNRFEQELRRYYYVTPKNYLDYIANYRTQLKDCNKKIDFSVRRLSGGLTKLVEAAKAVDQMQIELTSKKVVVEENTIKVEALIEQITEKTAIANEQQQNAAVKQKEVEESSAVIKVESAKAQIELDKALPAVEAAADALDNLEKKDITELKNFAKPPIPVMHVCLQVVALNPTNQKLDEDWKDAKVMLNNSNLLRLLKEYPKDSITEKQMKRVMFYFKNPDHTVEKMRSISKAGTGLLIWVDAVREYHEVAKNVEPLRLKVRTMEKEYAAAEKELTALNLLLGELETELAELNKGFSKANGELQALKEEAALMEKRLAAASKLITGLTSERTRWTADVAELNAQGVRLVGDCVLAAAFLSYSGAFTRDFRSDLIDQCLLNDIVEKKIPLTQPFKIDTMLATDATQQAWIASGLPADGHSIQNGILTTSSSRFALCIDPQQQAVNWIKKKESANGLKIKSMNDPDFMKHLELAIQFGNPYLFEAVDEEIDPMLDPILEKNTTMSGAQKMIKLGDKNIEWDDGFRLFMTTKLANPHYSPEIMGKLMIVNYSVTQDGLASQLLNVVVGHERPDLEKDFKDLVDEMSANMQIKEQLEDTLLSKLSSSQGNILDNEELIATLDETKTKAVEIGAKLEQAKFTKEETTKAREVYTPVAVRGSIMYFAMSGLSLLMSMYELSLGSFLAVFNNALDTAKKDVVLENRLRGMTKAVTEQMYDYTCTGIFERHKLMFSFQMTIMIMDGFGKLNRTEVDFFLKGDTSIEEASKPRPQAQEWVSEAGWKDLLCLGEKHEAFVSVVSDVENNFPVWKAWYDLESPETGDLPMEYTTKLSGLQQLLLYRCFRPDRVYNAVKFFVLGEMGEKYVQPPVTDFARIFSQSSATSPMIFILSPGADPQSDIQLLGEQLDFTTTNKKFKFCALGQGQGPKALEMMDTGAVRGHWVLLQNCHLMTSWLKTLEKRLELMQKPHSDFRLWLTTEPSDAFPLGIIQRSLKVVTEPPDGLKQNMRSSFSKIDPEMLDACPHWAMRPLLYVLCFLHAVVLERRKYGKIGWNVAYDFNESDFNISRRLLSLYLTKAHDDKDESIPWGSLKYLIGDAMYGGRVSDAFDRRVLITYLSEYMGDFLFDDAQHFYFSRSGFDYDLPEWGPLQSYLQQVEDLPLTNSPAVFGLHPNAEIGYFTNSSKAMWRDLINLQPRVAGAGGGQSREDIVSSMAQEVEGRVPEETDLVVVRKGLKGVPTPEEIVLLQELERFNGLTKRMGSTLKDVQRAVIGEIGMSDELDALADALFNGFLPALWRKLCPNTQKPLGSWMSHFTRRHNQYQCWIIDDATPKAMWLSGLHIPDSFLAALVQVCAAQPYVLDSRRRTN
jgi:dynein heavy chain